MEGGIRKEQSTNQEKQGSNETLTGQEDSGTGENKDGWATRPKQGQKCPQDKPKQNRRLGHFRPSIIMNSARTQPTFSIY